MGRLPTITTLAPLTPSDFLRILTDVRGSLVSQYTSLFGYSGVELRFTTPALQEICRQAADRGGGARGLRGIMVNSLFTASEEDLIGSFSTGKPPLGCDVRGPVSWFAVLKK